MTAPGRLHRPVMVDKAVDGLNIVPGGRYVDATFGRGGHSRLVLERLDRGGMLIAIDKDPEAVREAQRQFGADTRFTVEHGSFAQIDELVAKRGLAGEINGVLFDLGVSSPQLDESSRGFSFTHSGPLDMRMDPTSGPSAAEWIAKASEQEVARVLHEYGEERYARRIARAIVAARVEEPIRTTGRLAAIIRAAHPAWEHGQHPATRSFQAIRILINHELDELQAGLRAAMAVLAPAGRLVVISFHSLEDRIVKRFIQVQSRGDVFPPDLPVPVAYLRPTLRPVGRAARPAVEEIERNPRARSAVLRVAERLP